MDKISIDVYEGIQTPKHLFDVTLDNKQLSSLTFSCSLNRNALPIETAYHLRDVEAKLRDVLQDIKAILRKHKGKYDDIRKA
ncbi:hypothetical protein [Desulfococcus multivorans]|uniref:Uncharacterized protein n=1 Tax=Desulfococcus multivorans DSM 2059 TaxID=1121405 RepID=S7UZU7_DESML|nr:hypothetical protein [Desulfococcus multivorans]AOY60558.1 uncharacterized protein Dmul_37900 [Desulfococcus multivorans]AQV02656.1 hypothetical protein B2D07_18980 [Desulfococcus multivorans]EPR39734.1 hypothetical protein dsmv_2582 [Desulfococcus multivorans DSM 2059]SKA04975.1 hypothetical protein SAMN02745446_02569 [Desulfococcus multivorans DSM 2059]